MEVYRLYLEYNGKNFFGSQIQGNLRTVEKVLRDSLDNLLTKKYNVYFSSRTDAGVSALCNVVKLECSEKLNTKLFLEKLNYILPEDLQITKIEKVKKNFDVRHPKYKVYQYTIYNSLNKPTLYKEYVWWIKEEISYSKLKEVAKFFSSIRNFDFATLKEVTDTKKNTTCNIKIVVKKFHKFLILKFIGDRFLYRLIRNLVSLMVDFAIGKITLKNLKMIVKNWKWFKGKPAPANGLVLVKIVF